MTIQFCFDCDDTLYDMREPFDKARREVLPELKADSETFYTSCRQFSEEIFDQVQAGLLSVDQSGAYRIRRACEAWNQPITQETAEEFQRRYKKAQSQISMDPLLESWLGRTHAGLWILTNGPDDHQRKKLKALATDRFFPTDHVFTSGQVGFAKPDPKAFQAVTKDPSGFWYIGDNYDNDIVGAARSGWKTIHFDRRHQGSGPAADHIVYTEQELVSLLDQLERNANV